MQRTPSPEQAEVLAEINAGSNVVINAIPGAGKTTQILLYLDQLEDEKNILVLTYNRRLRQETKQKIELLLSEKFMPSPPVVHTFHSFCQNVFGVKCHTDAGIRKILDCNLEPITEISYDMLIIDECQDMTPLYFGVIQKILGCNPGIQLIILGDPRQSIYGYNGSDARYLTLAHQLLERDFKYMTLSTSYRMTRRVTDFINNCVLGTNLIQPSPAKLEDRWAKPIYAIINKNKLHKFVAPLIFRYLSVGYKPDDIFILCPSVSIMNGKNKKYLPPQVRLANKLSGTRAYECEPGQFCSCQRCCCCGTERCHHSINIFVPGSDDSPIVEEDVEGKIVFCTYHKAKGLERKIVIVLSFDMAYHKYYNKSDSPMSCCNPLYVAITRSQDKLILVQSSNPLPYVRSIEEYADVIKMGKVDIATDSKRPKIINPSSAIRHMRSAYVHELSNMVTTVERQAATEPLKLAIRHKQPETIEIVCDITGHYITAMFEWEIKKHIPDYRNEIFGRLPENIKDSDETKNMPDDKKLIYGVLKRTTAWVSEETGLEYKKVQIRSYNWISPNQHVELITRMMRTISKNSICEVPIGVNGIIFGGYAVDFIGRIDMIDLDKKIIWEVKCTEALQDDHIMQLATYKFIIDEMQKLDWGETIFRTLDQPIVLCKAIKRHPFLYSQIGKIVDKLPKLSNPDEIKLAMDQIKAKLDIYRQLYECRSWRYFLFNVKTNEVLQLTGEVGSMMAKLVEFKYSGNNEVSDEDFLRLHGA